MRDPEASAPHAAIDAAPSGAPMPRAGLALGLSAYLLWGVFPLYFKMVSEIPALEILSYRVVLALPVAALAVLVLGAPARVREALGRPRTRLVLLASALLIAANWLAWTYAVVTDRVLQSSLGYYVGPLVTVSLGMAFLGERLSRAQLFAVGMAAVGVAILAVSASEPPWLALIMAFTFSAYGLLRKQASADSVTGFFIETLFLAPAFIALMTFFLMTGRAEGPAAGPGVMAVLLFAGAATAAPLLLFAAATRRLRLSTMGLMQYIAPTGHFLIAMANGEPFTLAHAVTFALIWGGLAVFTTDAIWRERRARGLARDARAPEAPLP